MAGYAAIGIALAVVALFIWLRVRFVTLPPKAALLCLVWAIVEGCQQSPNPRVNKRSREVFKSGKGEVASRG